MEWARNSFTNLQEWRTKRRLGNPIYYQPGSVESIAAYTEDAKASLIVYFSNAALPHFPVRFVGYLPAEVTEEMGERIEETELRSSLMTLAYLEACFRLDLAARCSGPKRKSGPLGKSFWALRRAYPKGIPFDEILEAWKVHEPSTSNLVSQLRGALHFRHWMAHGSWWEPKFGARYDYPTIYALAAAIITHFSLAS